MPRNGPTLPTAAMAKASAMIRGKRSGAVINVRDLKSTQSGMDDMNAMFDAAETTQQPPKPPTKTTRPLPRQLTPRKKPKLPMASVSMALPGNKDTSINNDGDDDAASAARVQKYASDLLKKKKGAVLSPSEISRVSTLPPTPREGPETPLPENNTTEFDMPPPETPQEEEEQVAVAHAAAAAAEGGVAELPQKMQSPAGNDDFDMPQADDDELPADLGPPPAQSDDETSEEEDSKPAARPTPEKKKSPPATTTATTEEPPPPMAGLSDTESDDITDKARAVEEEDDDEDPGHNVVHDPETPKSVRDRRAEKEKAQIKKKKKKRTEEEEVTPPRRTKKKKKRNVVFSPEGIPISNREYESRPVSEYIEESPEDKSVRRSKRARCKPLAFWKNEKQVYGAHQETGVLGEAMGHMPVVQEIVTALPTPYRKRKPPPPTKRRKVQRHPETTAEVMDEEPFDSRKLRKKYDVIDGESALLWDDSIDESAELKVISYAKDMHPGKLPIAETRTKSESQKVGRAAQAFNIPYEDHDNYAGYIMGNLILPAHAIKDAESVGPCSQTFTVCQCQKGALEVAYGDPEMADGTLDHNTAQRFLVGPGDMFRVPPGNSYRLENHSSTTECLLTWTIIRPRNLPNES